ncbi:hypothetical protein CCP3SC5AM1_710014 [Gammaproteobacteria bacterium]
MSVAANSGEYMILYGNRGAHMEMLYVTYLLDRTVVLFDLPMQVVQPKEPVATKGGQSLVVG